MFFEWWFYKQKINDIFFEMLPLHLPFKTIALKNPSLYNASTVIGFSSSTAIVVAVVVGFSSLSKIALLDKPKAGTFAPSGKDCAFYQIRSL
jgi:hypothetical protein